MTKKIKGGGGVQIQGNWNFVLVSGEFELTELAGFYYTGVTCSSKQRVSSGGGGKEILNWLLM